MNFLSIPIILDTTIQKDEDNNIIPQNPKNIFLSFIPFKDNQEANNTIAQKLQLTTQDLNKGYKDINFKLPLLYLKDYEMFREWSEEIEEGEEISVEIARVKAFMYALRYGEGTLGERGYKTIVGGGTFDDFSKHPNIYIKKLKSTAAGAYQFLFTTWNDIVSRYGKKYNINDFSPKNQDRGCIILLHKYRESLDLIMKNKIDEAVRSRIDKPKKRLHYEWASLPDSPYGQRTETMENFMKYYNKHLEEELQGISNLAISNEEIVNFFQLLGV